MNTAKFAILEFQEKPDKSGYIINELVNNYEAEEVTPHGADIDRVAIEGDTFKVYLNCEHPVFRIDYDPTFRTIHLLDETSASYHKEAYTILSSDKGKGIILWTREVKKDINKTPIVEIWNAIKWSNQNPDGSVNIPSDRVKLIDAEVNND